MADWSETTVGNCLEPLALQKMPKVLSRDYKSSGSFPVIDQGQRLIAGWTDDEAGLISTHLPVVVFGDHTRAFKYVDFPFVRGADGTQVLKPKAGIDSLFFYYACRAIELPSRGYNRHFKTLKEQKIPTPPLQEQRSIAQALRRIDDALSIQDEQLQTSLTLKRAAMHTLFTRGLRGEAQKDTEIGSVPESWKTWECNDVAQRITVGVVVKPASHYVEEGVPAFRSLNVREDHLDTTDLVYFSNEENDGALSKSKLASGDVLVVRTGYPGTSCVVSEEFEGSNCIDLVIISPNRQYALPEFLSRFLNSNSGKAQARAAKHGLAQQHLNVGAIKKLKVPLPPTFDEQREVVRVLEAIDRKIDLHRRKRAVLEELFKALLHKLMTGEIRVGELDISALLDNTTQSEEAERIGGRA